MSVLSCKATLWHTGPVIHRTLIIYRTWPNIAPDVGLRADNPLATCAALVSRVAHLRAQSPKRINPKPCLEAVIVLVSRLACACQPLVAKRS